MRAGRSLGALGAASMLFLGAGVFTGTGAGAAPAVQAVQVIAFPVAGLSATTDARAAKKKVKVPSNYVYNPKLGARHDYCTDAPDEFPAPGAPNASFRGPCARHDLCYDAKTKKSTCDKALKKNMYANCDYWYGSLNPLRYACKTTALVYYAAVIIST